MSNLANDSLVDVDTVRYSVPHRLVKQSVEVLVGEREVTLVRMAEGFGEPMAALFSARRKKA